MSQTAAAARPATLAAPPVDPALRRARLVLTAAYAANGLLMATWFSRLPAVARHLQISTSTLGVVSAALTISTLVATPVAARRLPRWRASRIIRITAPATALAMLLAALAQQVWQLAVALTLLGLVNGIQGVGLNAHGTTLSRLADRSWMPALIGAASTGGVLGAVLGSIAVGSAVPVLLHLGLVSLLCLATGLAVGRRLPIGGGTSSLRIVRAAASTTAHRLEHRRVLARRAMPRPGADRPADDRPGRLRPHRLRGDHLRPGQLRSARVRLRVAGRRRDRDVVMLLLIGVGLGATLAEGALTNFGIVLFTDVLGARVSVAAYAFTVFSISMAFVRFAGGWLTRVLGQWRTMCLGGILTAACGLVLVSRPGSLLGFGCLIGVAVGIGCAVPVTFQAATTHVRARARRQGGDPDRAAAGALSRIGLATAGGYLSGGPIVGSAAAVVGLRSAVLIVAICGAAMAACAATLIRWEGRGRSEEPVRDADAGDSGSGDSDAGDSASDHASGPYRREWAEIGAHSQPCMPTRSSSGR